MLGYADLQDWADEGDLARAEIRLLPVVARFASDPGPTQIILGNDLSEQLRAFIKGRNLNVEALRRLLADLREASRSTAPKAATSDRRHLMPAKSRELHFLTMTDRSDRCPLGHELPRRN